MTIEEPAVYLRARMYNRLKETGRHTSGSIVALTNENLLNHKSWYANHLFHQMLIGLL